MTSFLALSLLLVGIVGLVLTQRSARTHLQRAESEAVRDYVQRRRRAIEAATVKDLEAIAAKVLAGAPLSRRDRKRAAALVRRLDRR